jgi:formamidopyrimidine-DNA glycosylase
MPELPDVTIYVEAIAERTVGRKLEKLRVSNPFLLRSVDPPVSDAFGMRVESVGRIGKRIVIGLECDLYLVLHLMIAGRLHWTDKSAKPPGRKGLAYFDFESGTLMLTEAGAKRRASLYIVRGRDALAAQDPGGLDVMAGDLAAFATRLASENRTLKRALTDPRLFSGIGNAYSDEILHRARLSPMTLTSRLDPAAVERLYAATGRVLTEWTEKLRSEASGRFPEKVTAFRPDMAVHGRYKKPCPVCASPVQRIAYASNEANYCATCQTGGKLLADRALSRLMHDDWPRSLEEMEELKRR